MSKNFKILSILVLITLIGSSQMIMITSAADIIPDKTVAAVADTTVPADVANVKATGGDGMVTINWDMATDNVAVKGYKIVYGNTSVSTDAGSYTKGPVDVGNVLTYDLKGLDNNKAYYFAITAYDAAGNESEFYSNEATATPKAGASGVATDTVAPKVISAGSNDKNGVSVVFSEAVKLPITLPEAAFSIKEDLTNVALDITKAEIDTVDKSGKTVLLTTADQKKASKYVLTAGIQLQDLSGNPIVSGTSDTAVFSGTDTSKAILKPAADIIKPAVDGVVPAFTSVKAIDSKTVEVTFSEPVVLLSNATENFIITDAADNTKITNINKVSVAQSGLKITLSTDDLAAKKYNLVSLKVKDAAGNVMPVESSATMFEGVAPVTKPTDTKPTDTKPADTVTPIKTDAKPVDAASNLLAKAMANLMISLSWKVNSAKLADVANFVVYMSTDHGVTYGDGVVLDKGIKSYDFKNLQENMVYYFKLTTRDKTGAESKGLVTFMTLPKTGPELGLLLFGSASFSAWFTRRKKR